MKVKIVSLFSVMALALALFLSVATTAAPKAAGAAAAPAATAQPNARPSAAPATAAALHPEIREAVASLRRAKNHMEHAAHDFGGHREEALKATDEAIRQLEICLKFDK